MVRNLKSDVVYIRICVRMYAYKVDELNDYKVNDGAVYADIDTET